MDDQVLQITDVSRRQLGAESAVRVVMALGEADGDVGQWLRQLGELLAQVLDLGKVRVERLLDQAVLAGLGNLLDKLGMRKIGRDDDDGVDVLVGKHVFN